jgi:hypothetical protein
MIVSMPAHCDDECCSHCPMIPRSLENAGLNAHSCSNTKPRSAALTKYNASQRKRLRIKLLNHDEDLISAYRFALESDKIRPEVSYPGPGQSAVRQKSSAFHAQNTETSCQ